MTSVSYAQLEEVLRLKDARLRMQETPSDPPNETCDINQHRTLWKLSRHNQDLAHQLEELRKKTTLLQETLNEEQRLRLESEAQTHLLREQLQTTTSEKEALVDRVAELEHRMRHEQYIFQRTEQERHRVFERQQREEVRAELRKLQSPTPVQSTVQQVDVQRKEEGEDEAYSLRHSAHSRCAVAHLLPEGVSPPSSPW